MPRRTEADKASAVMSYQRFKDDLIDGYALKYWKNGNLWQKSRMIKGKRDSFTLQFFDDGKFAGQALFKDDKLIKIICVDGRTATSLDDLSCAPGDDEL